MTSSPDWPRLFARRAAGIRLGLEPVRAAYERLGRPCAGARAVHLVGTNGKGSTAHALSHALSRAGLRVGGYTSPHLVSVTERVRLDGAPADERTLWEACRAVLAVADDPALPRPLSFFEVLTLAALRVFDRAGVEVVVLEAGLGGRLDATRVLPAAHLGVARIGLDHQAVLGPDLASIAAEKAGAMLPGQRVFSVPQPAEAATVLRDRARAVGASLAFLTPCEIEAVRGPWPAHLAGARALALALGRCLVPALSPADLPASPPPGRLSVVPFGRGRVLADVAHNADGIGACARMVGRWAVGGRADLVLAAVLRPREAGALLRPLAAVARHRAYVSLPEAAAPPAGWPVVLPGAAAAGDLAARWARRGGDVVVAGSFRLVGPVLARLGASPVEVGVADAVDPQDPGAFLERPPAHG